MSDGVICVNGIGKRYSIGERASYPLLRDLVAGMFSGSSRKLHKSEGNILWALREVSFDVKQGEVVGLVGRNGAGKSTLLKILARVTRPTMGSAEIHGRIGSLLEVGTGFHGELTGRENIFLTGSILGMRKAEIRRKFDEIVAFSEVERFLDTPLKHYSSGMQMRLAFAVAAHLEPEILLVDEVLAVGDVAFQKKCMGKMSDVAKHGRTIIFVSHQMAQIRRLCQRAIWVDGGQIRQDASSQEVVSAYESVMARGSSSKKQLLQLSDARPRFISWEIEGGRGPTPHTLDHIDPVTVRINAEIPRTIAKGGHGIALYDHQRNLVWSKAPQKMPLESGEHAFFHTFPMLPLRSGLYTWVVTLLDDGKVIDSWDCEPDMAVSAENYQTPYDEWMGILNLPVRFETRMEPAKSEDKVSAGDTFGI
jgi:ABC-type polysaccharide/polyol phosphate transport system ATPase subunit